MISNKRCMICNCTDSMFIATHQEEYKPWLRFTENPYDDKPGFICTDCADSIDSTINTDELIEESAPTEEQWDD